MQGLENVKYNMHFEFKVVRKGKGKKGLIGVTKEIP